MLYIVCSIVKLGHNTEGGREGTKECSKGGHRCTLFLPEIGYTRGDTCSSKDEAEQCAAYKALQKLK